MNPSRLCQLYDARFPAGVRSGHPAVFQAGPQQPVIRGTRYVDMSPMEDDDSGTRLAAYFTGGES